MHFNEAGCRKVAAILAEHLPKLLGD